MVLAKGTKEMNCLPHETADVTLGAVKLPSRMREAYLNLSWRRKTASPMVDTIWEVAYDQFVLSGNTSSKTYLPKTSGKVTFAVDEKTGALQSLALEGKELLASPVTLSLFRPATDNDNRDRKAARLWRQAGLDKPVQKVIALKKGRTSTTAVVELLNEAGKKLGDATLVYSLARNGGIKVQAEFMPDTTVVRAMARLGLVFEVNDTYGNVSYLGRGDHETYADRKQSGKIGIYNTTVERMFHYYVKPQATGNRTDVRWMKLADEADNGLFVDSSRLFQFSISPFTDENIEEATHINQLERNGKVTVHLDAEQSGVGTATCGPATLPPYLVPVDMQQFDFTIYLVK